MASDKVMSPPKKDSNRTGIVQSKSSIIEGPTAKTSNLNAYNRGKGAGKSK